MRCGGGEVGRCVSFKIIPLGPVRRLSGLKHWP